MTVICVLKFVGRREGPCVLASDEVRDDIALRRLLNDFGAQPVCHAVLCVISSRVTLGFRQLGRIRIPPLVVTQRGPIYIYNAINLLNLLYIYNIYIYIYVRMCVLMYICEHMYTLTQHTQRQRQRQRQKDTHTQPTSCGSSRADASPFAFHVWTASWPFCRQSPAPPDTSCAGRSCHL